MKIEPSEIKLEVKLMLKDCGYSCTSCDLWQRHSVCPHLQIPYLTLELLLSYRIFWGEF
jgi:hypothetical protein